MTICFEDFEGMAKFMRIALNPERPLYGWSQNYRVQAQNNQIAFADYGDPTIEKVESDLKKHRIHYMWVSPFGGYNK